MVSFIGDNAKSSNFEVTSHEVKTCDGISYIDCCQGCTVSGITHKSSYTECKVAIITR